MQVTCGRKSATAGKRSAQQVPPEAGELRGRAGERPCSIQARASRAIRRRRRAAGEVDGARRWERRDGGELARRRAQREGKKEREVSRGGESEAKALAEAGRGAVRAKRGGTRRQCAERQARERRERKHASLAERARGGTADVTPSLARRAARRYARRGSCTAAVAELRTASVGRRRRWRVPERSEGRGAPQPHNGAEPNRRAEAGKP